MRRTALLDRGRRGSMADESGAPNFAAVHRQLQRRSRVASYLLIPRERFVYPVTLLKRQRAVHRGALRRRNLVACANDFFRVIHTCSRQLRWDRARLVSECPPLLTRWRVFFAWSLRRAKS